VAPTAVRIARLNALRLELMLRVGRGNHINFGCVGVEFGGLALGRKRQAGAPSITSRSGSVAE
jgi:hypothetical protein